jgi:hypothetical protein
MITSFFASHGTGLRPESPFPSPFCCRSVCLSAALFALLLMMIMMKTMMLYAALLLRTAQPQD